MIIIFCLLFIPLLETVVKKLAQNCFFTYKILEFKT